MLANQTDPMKFKHIIPTVDYTTWHPPTDAEVEGIEDVNRATGFENDSFADDEILKVLLDSSQYAGQRDMTVWLLADTKGRVTGERTSPPFWYEVQITFYELEFDGGLELWDFNHQNVISSFLVKRLDDGRLGVLIIQTFGCGFELVCNRAKVVSVQPAEKRPVKRDPGEQKDLQVGWRGA